MVSHEKLNKMLLLFKEDFFFWDSSTYKNNKRGKMRNFENWIEWKGKLNLLLLERRDIFKEEHEEFSINFYLTSVPRHDEAMDLEAKAGRWVGENNMVEFNPSDENFGPV